MHITDKRINLVIEVIPILLGEVVINNLACRELMHIKMYILKERGSFGSSTRGYILRSM